MRLVLGALLVSLVPPLAAQSQSAVSPKDGEAFGNVLGFSIAGGGNPNVPYSFFPTRFQQIFNYDSFTSTGVVVVKSIDYRMAPPFADGRFGGQTTRVRVRMAFAAGGISAGAVSNQFASNLDNASIKTLINSKTINLPRLRDTSFGFKVPADSNAAFVWPGAAGKKHLVLEVFQYRNSNGNRPFGYTLDAWSATFARNGSSAPNGSYRGCPAANTRLVTHQPNAQLQLGSTTHAFTGRGQAPNLPGVVILGARPLNVTLPGTNCRLVNDLLGFFPGVSQGSSGLTRIAFPLARIPALGGVIVLTQMAWLQAGANRLGITTSRGLRQRIGLGTPAAPQVSTVAAWTNANGNPDTFTTGRVTRGFGLITQITN